MTILNKRMQLRHQIAGGIFATVLVMAPNFATAQDSVRDRLSPGNGPDWAGEPNAETNGFAGNDSTPLEITPPGPDQAWYRGNDGRFFYRDQGGRQIFEDQVYRRDTNLPNQRPMLGVSLQDTPEGLRIAGVAPNSSAAIAGLREGDFISRMGDRSATNAEDFTRSVGSMRPGDSLPLTINRNGQPQNLTATLGSQPMQYQAARPNWNSWPTNFNDSFNRMRQDFDAMRSELDQLRSDLDGIAGAAGAAAKQQTLDRE